MPEGVSLLSLVLMVVCLLLSAFFSASEAAFLSVQRVRIQHMVNTGVPGAQRVAAMVEHPERLLSIVLLGNNLVNTALAALGAAVAFALLDRPGQAVLASTIVITLLLLVLGEVVPKTVAARHPERMALLCVAPLRWLGWVLFPLARMLQGLSRAVVDRLGGAAPLRSLITVEEIKVLVSVGREAGTVEHGEAEMIHKVFRFGDRQVREVMTSRTEIIWVEKGTPLKEFLSLYEQHYHTRFPVFEDQVDNVIGVLSVKDVVRAMAQGALQSGDPVTTVMRPAYFVPETKLIGELFEELRQSGNQLAMVADEFGGVAGLVTLKRLIEEIVGRVGDEWVKAEEEYRAIDEHTFQVDAGMQVDEANEKLGLNIPEGDYETVAGFVLERLGRIPHEGDILLYNELRLVVTEMRGVKIETVTVTRTAHPDREER